MRRANVFVHDIPAGILEEIKKGTFYRFTYHLYYNGPSVSLTMPLKQGVFEYNKFPPFFEGLLPEGYNLAALLKNRKIDRNDFFSQLTAVGMDMVGTVTVEESE